MPAAIREFAETQVDPPVRGFVHIPETPTGNGLVLTHSAASNAQAPVLVAIGETFAQAGFTVLRLNLPFRQNRSFGPPLDAARDRAGIRNGVAALKKILEGVPAPAADAGIGKESGVEAPRIFLGGHSYGGRQASMLLAEEPALAAGLLLLSYPLHPERRPQQLRTQHLPNLRTPTLFIHGTRDPLGRIEELEQAIKLIPAGTKLIPVEGAGHDLGFKGKAERKELPQQILSECNRFFF